MTPAASHSNGSSHGRRLSPVDGSFLRLDSRCANMHVGFSAVFAAPEGRPRPSVKALRRRTAGRLHDVPWCRWRLDGAPLGLSEPRWVQDRDFDLDAHIVQLTEPRERVSYEDFAALRDTVLSTPLDRTRPLWQMFLVPCLEDGRVGLIGKMHHALVDGIAALQIVNLVVDSEADARSQPAVPWQPSGRPGRLGWALESLKHGIDDGIVAARGVAGALSHPHTAADRAARALGQLAGAVVHDVLPRAPRSTLNVPIASARTLVTYHARREELLAARKDGGTLNDIGLAAVAGALRALALSGGERPSEPLRAMVPVSMRERADNTVGNQISMVNIALPIHLTSASRRLDWVREQTDELKHTDRPVETQRLYQACGLVPAPLRTPVVRAMAAPRQFNLTVSQSPAPSGSLYLLGCELQDVYSVVPISQSHALAIGMVRYRRELFFGCYANPDALPDVHRLPALLAAELEELAAAPERSGGPRPRAARTQTGADARLPVPVG
jgi:WS/DGAT/MGAT family acyltransferase